MRTDGRSWMWLLIGATFAALGCENAIGPTDPTGTVELNMSAFRPVADSVISLPGLDDLREGDILSAELVVRNIGEDVLVISSYDASLLHLRGANGQRLQDILSLSERVVVDPPLDVPSGESIELFWTFTITPLVAQNLGLYSVLFLFFGTGLPPASTTIEITAP